MNKLWFRVRVLLRLVIGQALAGLVFFVVITPLAFLMRWFDRDHLSLNIKTKASYWSKRRFNLDSSSFNDQF